MKELRLDVNEFGDAGAVHLALCIHNIESLSVVCCYIDKGGVEALAQSIRRRDREVMCCIICSLYVTSPKLRNLHVICTLVDKGNCIDRAAKKMILKSYSR